MHVIPLVPVRQKVAFLQCATDLPGASTALSHQVGKSRAPTMALTQPVL